MSQYDGKVGHDVFFDDLHKGFDMVGINAFDLIVTVDYAQTSRAGDYGKFALDTQIAADLAEVECKSSRHDEIMLLAEGVKVEHIDGACIVDDQTERKFCHESISLKLMI